MCTAAPSAVFFTASLAWLFSTGTAFFAAADDVAVGTTSNYDRADERSVELGARPAMAPACRTFDCTRRHQHMRLLATRMEAKEACWIQTLP